MSSSGLPRQGAKQPLKCGARSRDKDAASGHRMARKLLQAQAQAAGLPDAVTRGSLDSHDSAPSLLERRDSPRSPEDGRNISGSAPDAIEPKSGPPPSDESYFAARRGSHTRHYDVARTNNLLTRQLSPPRPQPDSREWSFGSAWSWGSESKWSATVRYAVTGTGGYGSAAPLVGMSKAPDVSGRLVVAGRLAIKILQVSTAYQSSPNSAHPVVDEVEDVRGSSRLGKSYSISDVKWGYAGTSRKLLTGCSNGCVILWDLDANKRLEATKFEHDRAVNRVLFAGGSGNWMISAAQDGFCKLWDVRTPSVANLVLASFADPARDVASHPVSAAPFLYTICTLHDSGTLQRWDLRRASQPVDRIQAHAGGGLSMIWRGTTPAFVDEETQGDGYLATSGMDRTVKVWRMPSTGLAARPLHTLHTTDPAARLSWRPNCPTQIVTVPLAAAGLGEAAAADDAPSSRLSASQIEIWDVRRPHMPKLVIPHPQEGAASSVLVADAATVWTTHKTGGYFMQHDIDKDAIQPHAGLPRTALGWASNGEFAFAVTAKTTDFVEDKQHTPNDLDVTPYDLEQELAGVVLPELDFDAELFRYLATHYLVEGLSFEQLCSHNAGVAADVNRIDAAQTWKILARWFGHVDQAEEDLTASTVAGESVSSFKLAGSLMSSGRRDKSLTPAASPARKRLASESRKLSLVPESRDSGEGTDDETSEAGGGSRMTESHSSVRPNENLQLASSSESEDFFAVKPAFGMPEPDSSDSPQAKSSYYSSPMLTGATPSEGGKSRSSSKSSHAAATPRPGRADLLSPPFGPRGRRTVSPNGSSSDSDDSLQGPYGSAHTAARILKNQRRALSDFTGAPASATTSQRTRARSRTRRVAGQQLSKTASALAGLPTRGSLAAQATVAKHQEREARERQREVVKPELDTPRLKKELAERLDGALKEVLLSCAEEGDVQMCVTVILAMRGRVDFDEAFRVRTTTAYLDLLKRFDLHVAAANIMTASLDDRFRLKNTLSTTVHTACGRCKKGLNDPPFGLCKRCRTPAIRCTICHRSVRSTLLGICAVCGHAVHRECIAAYLQPGNLGSHSALPSHSSMTTTPAPSDPSTPRFFFGGAWLWGNDEGDDTPYYSANGTPSPRLSISGGPGGELLTCPSGCVLKRTSSLPFSSRAQM